MTEDRLPLNELLQKAGDGDFLRAVAESVLQLLMEADVEGLIGAGRHERVARELYAFRAMVEAAMGRVIAEEEEAREIFSKAPRFDEDPYNREFDSEAGVSRTSLEALHAREHFTKNAFSELRGACLSYGGLLTAEFLGLESLMDKFASCTVDEEMLNIRDQPTVVRVGYNDGLEEELAVIEAKAHHLREEAAKGMAKASTVMADTAEAEAAISDPAPS